MTLLSHVVKSNSDVSSDRINLNNNLYNNGSTSLEVSRSEHTTKISSIADESTSTTSYEYTIQDLSLNSEERPKLTTSTSNLTVFNSASTDTTKRYQTKMLLASLIEHFCKAYGDKPDANRKVFFLICQTLRSLGIIDAEFVDEMTSVRSSFQQAFHKLFFTAVQTVRNQDLLQFDDNLPRLIKPPSSDKKDDIDGLNSSDYFTSNFESSSSSEPSNSSSSSGGNDQIYNTSTKAIHKKKKEQDYFSSHTTSSTNEFGTSFTTLNNISPPMSSKLSTSSSTFHSFVHGGDLFHNLSVQNSRYNNDFVEINLLGKGGFASAFRARNKLDGIDYAIKKIRLGSDIEESDRLKENPYEKIFREIKNLARLEHVNVIRYYSSWLEYDETDDQGSEGSEDWEESLSRMNNNNRNVYTDESSVFDGRDPTFDSDLSSIRNYHGYPPSESGMSQIQFGDSSGGYEAGGNDSSSISTRPSSLLNKKSSSKSISRQTGWTLFIQMQLCPTTLHDYIRFRNKQYYENEIFNSNNQVVDTNRNIEIFSQILQGTAYIHEQGLIHRDLKPSNIFLSMPNAFVYIQQDGRRKRVSSAAGCLESSGYSSSGASYRSSYDAMVSENGLKECMWEESWVPKIGDFGLAAEAIEEGENGDAVLIPTPISSTPPSPKFSEATLTLNSNPGNVDDCGIKDANLVGKLKSTGTNNNNNSRPKRPKPRRTRTIGVGTRTYASPEQLAIPAQAYDEKVDIYSLGIILFELFQPFATGMERADSLDKLKRGVFPDGFLEMYPKVSALIIWMMNEKPDQRPSARQLLEFELFSHPEDVDIYATLQAQLKKKSSIIEDLKKKVERVELEKRIALSEMQERLDEMQRQLDSLQGTTTTTTTTEEQHTSIKKCILSQSPSFLKKKKEVRWSVFHSDI